MIERNSPVLPPGVTLRQLRAFIAVAQTGSMVRAAERMYLTPSALSMLVGALESEIAVRLFDRTTRRVTLSDAGKELLPSLQRAFDGLDDAFSELRRFVDRRELRLIIATSPLLAAQLIPPLLASFRVRFPAIKVELLDVPVGDVAGAVRCSKAELGICTAGTHAQDLVQTVLHQDRLMLVCSSGHVLAGRSEVRWRELCGEPLVLLKPPSGLRVLVDRAFQLIDAIPTISYEVSQVSTALGLVSADVGSSVLPSFVKSSETASVPLVEPVVTRDIIALTVSSKSLSAAGAAFLSHFRQTVSGEISLHDQVM